MYKIVASYRGGAFEHIDNANDLEQALWIREQYLLAFDNDWRVVYYNIED